MKAVSAASNALCGAVMADKPEGMPSTALVAALRRKLGMQKAGHTGILDRAASGLMLLLLGRATCFADFFLHADKEYVVDFHFGRATDTHDRDGTVTAEITKAAAQNFLREKQDTIQAHIAAWINLERQHPPIYSALKKDGKRLSDQARLGYAVETSPRPIKIYTSKLLEYDVERSRLQVLLHVSGGTYVRSLARDLGKALGIPVCLGALRRSAVGVHRLDQNSWEPEKNHPQILSPQQILPEWPCMKALMPQHVNKVMKGAILPIQSLQGEAPKKVQQNFFIENEEGTALAWAVRTTGAYRYRRILKASID